MNVLVACERSGVVRDAFLARGHNAYSCDIFPTDSTHPDKFRHYMCDALDVIHESFNWDLMIAHPECTYLTLAGAKHLYKLGPVVINGKTQMQPRKEHGLNLIRWEKMRAAAEFYNALKSAKIPHICLENPVMHGHAMFLVGHATQFIQPHQHGHAETKKTGLRLINLPPLVPTKIIPPDFEKWPPGKGNGYEPKCHFASPGPNRGKDRSRTLIGIAQAMATQWGE